ncbi:MAG: GDSL-type esterase/lipase family protein [Treponema sp.]|nr:GDSL-type esterase/lipase family protein [Treponema sp.]
MFFAAKQPYYTCYQIIKERKMANQLMQFFADIPDEKSRELVRQKTEQISKTIEDNTIWTFACKVKNYNFLNKKAKHAGTIFAGDSIAEMFPVSELLTEQQDSCGTPLYNRGISGELSGHFLARLDENILSISPKNLILIIGTNDVAQGISAETIRDTIARVINKVKESVQEINIILMAIFPVNEYMPDIPSRLMVGIRTNPAIKALNILLKTLAKKENIHFVDMPPKFMDQQGQFSPDYTFDGLHPNAEGYAVIAEAIISLLR